MEHFDTQALQRGQPGPPTKPGGANWFEPWAAEVASGYVRPSAAEAMRAQPGFHDAMLCSLRGLIESAAQETELRRLMHETSASFLALTALYLDATCGLTHRRLREFAGMSGVLGVGRVTALLLAMQMKGYVEAAHEAGPGRRKLYRPTATMTETFRLMYRRDLEAIVRMTPDGRAVLDHFDAPGGLSAFAVQLGRLMLGGVSRFGPAGDPALPRDSRLFQKLARRTAAVAILFTVLHDAAVAADRFPAAGPVQVSISSLAQRFGVSRPHVRNILRRACAYGFLAEGSAKGEMEVRPALVETIEQLYGMAFIVFGGCAYLAAQPAPSDAPEPEGRPASPT